MQFPWRCCFGRVCAHRAALSADCKITKSCYAIPPFSLLPKIPLFYGPFLFLLILALECFLVPAACSITFGKLAVFRIFEANEIAQAHLFSFVVFLYLWKTVGFTALVLHQKIRRIPLELSETAADLGAAPLQIFFKIQLPILIPAIADSLAIALLGSFRLFREAYLLAGPHPQGRLYSLQHFYYNNFANLNAPRLAAASILQTVMITLFAALLFRRDSRHETHK